MSDTASAPRRSEPAAGRCPSCAARTRPRERWCSLCHTPLTAPGASPAAAAPAAAAVPDAPPADEVAGPPADEVAGPPADEVAAMLAELAATARGPAPASRGTQVLLAAGGAVALAALLLMLLTLAGLAA